MVYDCRDVKGEMDEGREEKKRKKKKDQAFVGGEPQAFKLDKHGSRESVRVSAREQGVFWGEGRKEGRSGAKEGYLRATYVCEGS